MNLRFPAIALALGLIVTISASADEVRLRVGHAHKPAEAKLELEQIKGSIPDLESWKKRRAKIRAGILAGAGLSKLPERTPLNPRFVKKRTHPGYIAENVAIESAPGFFVTGTEGPLEEGELERASDWAKQILDN